MREASVGAAGHIADAGKRQLDEEYAPMASITWQPGTFRIMTPNGAEQAEGLVSGPFGLCQEPRRFAPVWTATHLATGLRISLGNGAGFHDLALAQQFAEQLLPLADWSTGVALAADKTLADRVVAIWNELIVRDVVAMNMAIAATYAAPQREKHATGRRKR